MHNKENNAGYGIAAVIVFGLIACLLYGLGGGIRADIGILLNPLADNSGISYQDASFCIAAMELVFGITQPFFGMLAARKSNRFVLILGSVLLMIGLGGMYAAHSFIGLLLSLGFLFGAGAGALAFGLVLASAIHFVGEQNAMLIAGMLNAASGMFSFALSPAVTALLDKGGLALTLLVLGILSALLIPAALAVTSRDAAAVRAERAQSAAAGKTEEISFRQVLGGALKNRTYRLLMAGFFTCGFHMIIIESHLYSQYVADGLAENKAGWAFSFYGIATILGTLLSGFLSTRVHKGRLLGFYYGFRAVWAALYMFVMPHNFATAVIFAGGLGLTGDATVSPTSGLVHANFPLRQSATLIGLLFALHQIGAFLSAWLGGIIAEATGGYTLLWVIDIALCVMASACSLRIARR
ncbi:MAG: MFS transporter [Lachnospiraceae bacterium]|jgi:predicted MFS family arabinose efflux permease